MTTKPTHNTTGSVAPNNAPTEKQVHLISTLQEELEVAIDKIAQEGTKHECSHLIDALLMFMNDYVIHPRLPKREKEATPSSAQ